VIALCLLASAIAGVNIFHWYRTQNIEPAYTRQIPHTKWTRPLDRSYPVWSPPYLGKDGTLYIAATDGVHAVDPSSAMRWDYRMSLDDPIMRGGLFQDDSGYLYVATANHVYSLTAGGVKRWQADCARAAFTKTAQGWPPNANVLYTTCDTHFAALSKSDGSETWTLPEFETQGPPSLPTAPLMLNNGMIVFEKQQRIFATDRSGKTLWTYPPDNLPAAILIGAGRDDTVYAANLTTGFDALNAKTGSVKWTFQGGPAAGFNPSPVTAPDGTIYVAAARGPLFALFDDGSLNWTFRLPARQTTDGYASPLLGSDGIIYLLLDRSVIAVSPTGKLIWQIDLPGPNIANGFLTLASDGTLYVVTDTAVIHAVQTASHGPAGNSGSGS
jgi:outer membrane protein assembly factor BamB